MAEADANGVVLRTKSKNRPSKNDKRHDLWTMKRMSRSFDNDISNLGSKFNENLLIGENEVEIDDNQELKITNDVLPEITKEVILSEQQIQPDSSKVYLMVNFKDFFLVLKAIFNNENLNIVIKNLTKCYFLGFEI